MAITAVASGIQTFLQAQQKLSQSAQQIAEASISEQGTQALIEPVINMRVAEQEAKAAARIIEVEENIIGTLLDIKV